ncbi:MAG TPA: hypothetical protein VH062_23015 [Polyangiaceae bacterium]|jgi:hypothetical protein|nr:hypothetical protein [Polyangiaceae bacterium]
MLRAHVSVLSVTVSALLAVGCGGTSGTDTAKKSDTPKKSADTTQADQWKTIITGDWSLDPGTESYTCVRQTLDEDVIVSKFDAINPLGTHHTLLTVGDPDQPDGIGPCTAADNHPLSIFGSGVGTNEFDFPDGVAVKVEKGKQLLLNLHLFNTSADPLTGTSGTRVQVMKETDVKDFAEGILAGTIDLNLPPHEETTSIGYCAMSHDVTIFSVAPHMHQLGTHMKIVAEPAGADEIVLHDGPYDFSEQRYYAIDPLQLSTGDNLRVECTHTNTTDKLVTFGDSSLAEMCFAGIYRYPADGDSFPCVANARL